MTGDHSNGGGGPATAAGGPPRLALGPVQYFWPAERLRAFYRAAREWPVEVVYLGEVVCAKRQALGLDDWLEIAGELSAAGKEVVLSTLALLEAGSELGRVRRICAQERWRVEANDMAAVRFLRGRGFVAGPHINSYNASTLEWLHELGASRWVMPVELPATTLRALQQARPPGMETEVLVFGHMPLALSARCFTARAHGLPKDRCEFRCGEHPAGMDLETREGERLFVVNGVQIQSGRPCNLLPFRDELLELGVDLWRLSPQVDGMEEAVAAFDAARRGERAALPGSDWCNGYWAGEPGMVHLPAGLEGDGSV